MGAVPIAVVTFFGSIPSFISLCMPVSTVRPDTCVDPAILVVGAMINESPLTGTLHLFAISLITDVGGSVSVSSNITVVSALSM